MDLHPSPLTFMGHLFTMHSEVEQGKAVRFVVESVGDVPKEVADAAECYFGDILAAMKRATITNMSELSPATEWKVTITVSTGKDGGSCNT